MLKSHHFPNNPVPVGQLFLHSIFHLEVPQPHTLSYVIHGSRKTEITEFHKVEYYPLQYNTDGTPLGNLRFALRYEPLDLNVIIASLRKVDKAAIEKWVLAEPTGAYSRRTWFLYETFVGEKLDIEDASSGNYVDVLDEKFHFVSKSVNSKRYRIRNNLIGNIHLCPVIRKTIKLEQMISKNLSDVAKSAAAEYSSVEVMRAVSYLYTQETRTTFAIEGEKPSASRQQRYVSALQSISSFNPAHKHDLIQLQQAIVEPRYHANDYRTIQNFVGSTNPQYQEDVHYICPRPDDVTYLMTGWINLTKQLLSSHLDSVIIAAVCSFAFVYIHPFEDGNGRLHRFLIHSILNRCEYTPPGIIVPISAVIYRKIDKYYNILNSFSQSILEFINWELPAGGEMVIHNNTVDLYRFPDLTLHAEFLYECLEDAIRIDLKQELEFLAIFDRVLETIKNVVDMPDRRAHLLARLLLQNSGKLSKRKRGDYAELTDTEIEEMERGVQDLLT